MTDRPYDFREDGSRWRWGCWICIVTAGITLAGIALLIWRLMGW